MTLSHLVIWKNPDDLFICSVFLTFTGYTIKSVILGQIAECKNIL
jgi:hypothetical protein